MKILHCCLAAFYIDGFGYQENVLPKMHQLQGHNVAILASTETYADGKVLSYVKPSSYSTEEGIPITRLAYSKWLPRRLGIKLRFYEGLYNAIEDFNPDVIFLHDCQFLGIRSVVKFAKEHPQTRIYVDGHTDFINSARSWVSKHILHGIIYRYCAQLIEPYTTMFYGVLPVRVEFFQSMYGIPAEKTDLLVLGADHTVVDLSQRKEIRTSVRAALGISEKDFVLVTGGKIDRRKNIHRLMRVFSEFQDLDLKLIVFGRPNEEMESEIAVLSKSSTIKYVGWVPAEKTYDYLLASDLGFFPGTHSVLWEQSVGIGLPCVFKKWDGIQHVDVGGNCLFLDTGSDEEIKEVIFKVWKDRDLFAGLQKVALEEGIKQFSYYDIAKRAIES